ncbi:MAG: hypothetical protein M3256_25390 [Actinomycetota bacterium]|nr:hypothetical protein [Actinomycetota bacterium]
MNPPYDPSTLFATSAASAGALVAIIGGFLISRVIGLAFDKERLDRHLRELSSSLQVKRQRYDQVHDERHMVSTRWFDRDHLKDIIDAKGEVDLEQVMENSNYRGTTMEEMQFVAQLSIQWVKDAWSTLGAMERPVPLSAAELRARGAEVPPGADDIFEAVARRIRTSGQPRQSRSAFDIQTAGISPIVPTSDLTYTRQDQRIRDEQAARFEVGVLEAEIRATNDELGRLRRPPRLRSAIAILGYFAGGSVMYPMVLLTMKPVPSTDAVRWSVVGLFASGLVSLLMFLAWTTASLGGTIETHPELIDPQTPPTKRR